MERMEFVGWIKILQDEYGKAYGKNAVELAWGELQRCRNASMRNSIDRVMLGANHLPPLQRVIDETLRAEKEATDQEIRQREASAAEEKEQYRKGAARAFSDQSGIASQSVLLVRAILAGKITRAQALEGMRHLDTTYPHAGFANEGAKLASFYEQRGLDLSRPCGNYGFDLGG